MERLVRHLYGQGVGIAIATSSHKRHFDLKTTLHTELFKLFDHVVTGDLVKNGKPDPEIFLTCMEGFKVGQSLASWRTLASSRLGRQQ